MGLIDEDFELILNCAIRYALGRRTYIVKTVIDYTKPFLPRLSNRTLKCIKTDIETSDSLGNENIDKPEWLKLLHRIEIELSEREK